MPDVLEKNVCSAGVVRACSVHVCWTYLVYDVQATSLLSDLLSGQSPVLRVKCGNLLLLSSPASSVLSKGISCLGVLMWYVRIYDFV